MFNYNLLHPYLKCKLIYISEFPFKGLSCKTTLIFKGLRTHNLKNSRGDFRELTALSAYKISWQKGVPVDFIPRGQVLLPSCSISVNNVMSADVSMGITTGAWESCHCCEQQGCDSSKENTRYQKVQLPVTLLYHFSLEAPASEFYPKKKTKQKTHRNWTKLYEGTVAIAIKKLSKLWLYFFCSPVQTQLCTQHSLLKVLLGQFSEYLKADLLWFL